MTPTAALVSAIRNLVAAAAPQELAEFEAELAAADADAVTVLGRWALRADPLTPQELAAVERFKRTGDCTGMLTRDADGQWLRL